jgi:hypothetical protein
MAGQETEAEAAEVVCSIDARNMRLVVVNLLPFCLPLRARVRSIIEPYKPLFCRQRVRGNPPR